MNKAFTLIELLVVVLIIGILSAIALPQYTVAVEKSRIAEAYVVMKSLLDAGERYVLENSTTSLGSSPWEKLDISYNFSEVEDDEDGYYRQGKNFCYSIEELPYVVVAWRGNCNDNNDYSLEYYGQRMYAPYTLARHCYGETAFGQKVCKSICGSDNCYY